MVCSSFSRKIKKTDTSPHYELEIINKKSIVDKYKHIHMDSWICGTYVQCTQKVFKLPGILDNNNIIFFQNKLFDTKVINFTHP